MKPLENNMVIGDYYDRRFLHDCGVSSPASQDCHGCLNTFTYHQDSISCQTGFCPDCRVRCAWCGDWMAGWPETVINGARWHVGCMEAKAEEEAHQARMVCLDNLTSWKPVLTHPAVLIAIMVASVVAVYAVYVFTT